MFKLLLITATALAVARGDDYIDECSQYATCQDCLDVASTEGAAGAPQARDNCGWCHFNVIYEDGTTGPRCADIRDKPWVCTDLYDTYQCSSGYSCDFNNGTCFLDEPGEGWADEEECEEHCFETPSTYMCDVSTYTCVECEEGQQGCLDKESACENCEAPSDDYFDDDTVADDDDQDDDDSSAADDDAPQVMYSCDPDSLTCVEDPSGVLFNQTCDSQCTNSTPPALVGTWRGLEAHAGFAQGEWDYQFDGDNVEIKDPTGAVVHATVGNYMGQMVLTFTDGDHAGETLKALDVTLNNGVETETHAFAFGDYGADAPATFAQAMAGANGQRVHIVSKCNDWKGGCNFTTVFDAELFRGRPLHDADPCNQFMDCSSCIGQTLEGLQCGWCLGGDIVYNDTGDSGLHCGGFVDGAAPAFTCAPQFRTTDCTGYSCNWTATEGPQCYEQDGGDYPDEDSCDTVCSAQTMAKCDPDTKTCNPCDPDTDPDCVNTQAYCDASCGVAQARCDVLTGECKPCDDDDMDDDCMSAGECDTACQAGSYSLCTPKGECVPCDPTNTTGCVTTDACNSTCVPTPSDKYGCDWSNSTSGPVCVAGLGKESLADCEDSCVAASTKCDYSQGVCVDCDPATETCYTEAYCEASCAKSDLIGVWRAIEIETGFTRGEWDFTFFEDGTLAFTYHDATAYQWEASVDISGSASEGTGVSFTITQAPDDQSALPFQADVDQVLSGFYKGSDGQWAVTEFMYLAFSAPDGDTPATFDDAMNDGFEFVLVSCKDAATCDFSSAALVE